MYLHEQVFLGIIGFHFIFNCFGLDIPFGLFLSSSNLGLYPFLFFLFLGGFLT